MTDAATTQPETIGLLFRLGRTTLRMRQADAALRLEVSQATLSAWENDVTLPSFPDLVRVCRLYRIDIGHVVSLHEAIVEAHG